MPVFFKAAKHLSVVGVFTFSTALSVEAVTVGRCNVMIDGVYKPVLVVKSDTGITVHQIGSDGLTRSIVFNPKAAVEWAASISGVAAADVEYSVDCHSGSGDTLAAPPPPPPPPPPGGGGGEDPCGPPVDPCGPPVDPCGPPQQALPDEA